MSLSRDDQGQELLPAPWAGVVEQTKTLQQGDGAEGQEQVKNSRWSLTTDSLLPEALASR